jgi:hypothetical protein
MSRKTPFNCHEQAPGRIFASIRKKFTTAFNRAGTGISTLAIRYSRQLGTGMLCFIGISAVCCFTISRGSGPLPTQMDCPTRPLLSGVRNFYTTVSTIAELHTLYDRLDLLSKQKHFSHADSLMLMQAVQHIQDLQQQFSNGRDFH